MAKPLGGRGLRPVPIRGSIQRSPNPLAGGEGLAAHPQEPHPRSGPSGLANTSPIMPHFRPTSDVTESKVISIRKICFVGLSFSLRPQNTRSAVAERPRDVAMFLTYLTSDVRKYHDLQNGIKATQRH